MREINEEFLKVLGRVRGVGSKIGFKDQQPESYNTGRPPGYQVGDHH